MQVRRRNENYTVRVAPCGCMSLIDLVNIIEFQHNDSSLGKQRFFIMSKQIKPTRRYNDMIVCRGLDSPELKVWFTGHSRCYYMAWMEDIINGNVNSISGCNGKCECQSIP